MKALAVLVIIIAAGGVDSELTATDIFAREGEIIAKDGFSLGYLSVGRTDC